MSYTEEVYERVVAQNPGEPEFHQAVKEVLDSLKVVIDRNEEKYRSLSILERLVEPERIISFRVPWIDDNGNVQINKGYRVQFNSAMNEIGVTGITITNVMGCGVQKGSRSYYRGVEMDMNLLPKIKIEIVVSLVPVRTVIETAKKTLHTGQYGDGKVFVYDIENVVKIRTGEEGFEALQDTQPLE